MGCGVRGVQGRIKVQYSLGDRCIDIMRSPPNTLPKPHVRMDVLFRLLDRDKIVQLVTCLWLEYKVLLYSSRLSVLTIVAETLVTLLYPFKWEHVYVPVLPLQLLDFVSAPTPFIMGVHPGTLPSRRDTLLNRHPPTTTTQPHPAARVWAAVGPTRQRRAPWRVHPGEDSTPPWRGGHPGEDSAEPASGEEGALLAACLSRASGFAGG